MRGFLISVALAALMAACSPPASQQQSEAPEAPVPELACNTVAPDSARQVAITDSEGVASAASDLRGGSLTPGIYDLVRATRIGAPSGWQNTQAVAIEISESAEGVVTLNWVGAPQQGQVDRWTAEFREQPQRIAFTCGRIGEVEAQFQASGNALELRLPDGANGALLLNFERRA
jgi:hypothetical protein